MTRPRTARSLAAETAFRARLEELGATLLEPEWLGAMRPHRLLCIAGHECSQRPNRVQQGLGICRTCARQDPSTAEAEFRARIAELGGELLEREWLGSKSKHRAICAAGHLCHPTPSSVRGGNGICPTCAGMDQAAVAAAFYARVTELGGTVLGEYRSAHVKVRARCAAGHECYPIPQTVRKGGGICRTCSRCDPAAAEAGFRARLAELGATLLEPGWLGSDVPHRVHCAAGHECAPKPNKVVNCGRGICRTCSGRDPAAADAAFRARLAALGATLLEAEWLGANTPHRAECSQGHLCYPTPGHVSQGIGVCLACKGKAWDAFYVVTSASAVKFGITSGDPQDRLRSHARDGFTEVIRVATTLPAGVALDTERAVRSALTLADERPLRGREYFDISCLALILDVANSWLALHAVIPRRWVQAELFAA